MMTAPETIVLRQPDDWHLHLRDGDMMHCVLPYSAAYCRRAIIMPNLQPPVTDVTSAVAYHQRIIDSIPAGVAFEPLMTCYLTDTTDAMALRQGFEQKIFVAAKFYPAHATTHSSQGISDWRRLAAVFDAMQSIGMPLLIHGEATDPAVDIFDREAHFIDTVLVPLLKDFPSLKVVLEHISTAEAAQFILSRDDHVAATVTPQHLHFNRNALFAGGLRPHHYCLPVLKHEKHRQALRCAVTSGNRKFFMGTDSAPHDRHHKESSCGCAGIFNAPTALSVYAAVFEEENQLENLEAFLSINGAVFYGRPLNEARLILARRSWQVPAHIRIAGQDNESESLVPFLAGETLSWQVVGLRNGE